MRLRPNIVLAVITGTVVMLAVVAAVFSLRQQSPIWDSDSPEGVVQRYAEAIVDADYARAAQLLDPDLGCTEQDFEQSYYPQSTAISIPDSQGAADQVSVTVNITSYGDPFFDRYTQGETFELLRSDSQWLITGNPWPVYDCVGTQ